MMCKAAPCPVVAGTTHEVPDLSGLDHKYCERDNPCFALLHLAPLLQDLEVDLEIPQDEHANLTALHELGLAEKVVLGSWHALLLVVAENELLLSAQILELCALANEPQNAWIIG